MFRRILNIPEYLHLKDVGLLELLFAFTPMLSGFSFGEHLPLSIIMWIILIPLTFVCNKRNTIKNFKPLSCFIAYWAIIILCFISKGNINTNIIISEIIFFLAIYCLYPIINITKLNGSLNWVALIAIGGLIYQWGTVGAGGAVHPIEIPGLTMSESRLEILSNRPSSFFMEPQAYVNFMWMPLFLSLLNKKYIWTAIIILSIFLTSSTTGLITSFLMLIVYIISQNIGKKNAIIITCIGVGLFFALTKYDAFKTGVEKFNDTDTETNIRLVQGPYIVGTMNPSEYVFGSGESTAYNYCIKSARAPMVIVYGESVYMSTFWNLILLYGIIGLILYINIYFRIIKTNKQTLPFVACAVATLFSDPTGLGAGFAVQLIFLLVICKQEFNPYYENSTYRIGAW